MDGDGPRLADLDAHLAEGGCLYLDEAHAVGLYEHGRGRAAALRSAPTVIVAPLGKAFGCAGAIVAGSSEVCGWIRAHARSFVFTTGVSPVLLPRLARALALVRGPIGEARRERLWRNVELLRRALGLEPVALPSPIVPMIIGANHDALELSDRLIERGWHVQAIRPPTVPEGSARLRITVSAMHEIDELERFAADLLGEVGGRR
jgi:7-keto-8-aminopelargonate synthetase-like enzyme